MSLEPSWNVSVNFTEEDDRTRADAILDVGGAHFHGWGRAKRSSGDPNVPVIGEELAAARALADLSHQLLHATAEKIDSFDHRSTHIQ